MLVKEKLKMFKYNLKSWSKEHVANFEQLNKVKEELRKWDLKGESSSLLSSEAEQHRDCIAKIQLLSRLNCNMLRQKLRNK